MSQEQDLQDVARTFGCPRKTERQRQLDLATERGDARVFQYRCADGELFEAIASTESGAFCVLNAERPGMRAIRCEGPSSLSVEAGSTGGPCFNCGSPCLNVPMAGGKLDTLAQSILPGIERPSFDEIMVEVERLKNIERASSYYTSSDFDAVERALGEYEDDSGAMHDIAMAALERMRAKISQHEWQLSCIAGALGRPSIPEGEHVKAVTEVMNALADKAHVLQKYCELKDRVQELEAQLMAKSRSTLAVFLTIECTEPCAAEGVVDDLLEHGAFQDAINENMPNGRVVCAVVRPVPQDLLEQHNALPEESECRNQEEPAR